MTRFLWRVPAGTRRKNKGGDAKKYDDIPRRKTDTAGVREWMRTAAEKAADIIFPPNIYCMACGVPIRPDEPYSLCSRCLQEISWANGKLCRVCGKLLEDWYPVNICGECVNRTRNFDRGVTCMQYREIERKIIRDFKYRGKSFLSRKLSEIICDKILAEGLEFDIIVPVPMYAAKERKRGYNQAALLGRYLGLRLGVPCQSDFLYRIRDTAPMSRLGLRDRKRNLDGAFSVSEAAGREIPGRRILLIDDIYTTGTTAEHCSGLLKSRGAAEVYIASLAAGINQRELPQTADIQPHMNGDFGSGRSNTETE